MVLKLTKDLKNLSLADQMNRAAVSIASNIAEGAERNTNKDFNRFIAIAAGSAAELHTKLEILKRVEGSFEKDAEDLQGYCKEVSAMLWSLRQSLDKA
jgi:four helix bundle protein